MNHLSSWVPIFGPRIVPILTQWITVDYKLWGVMQERVYQKPIQDIDDLKRRLIAAWSGIHQQVIDQAIDQWRERL